MTNLDTSMSSMIASVVVPVRGRSKDLALCLDCILQQSQPAETFEILVCDDGTNGPEADEIAAVCRRDPRIRRIWQPNRGPAAARNLGVANARADIIAFTDSDTLPTPAWLAELLAPFADPTVIAVEGPVRTPTPADSPLQEAPRNEGGVHLTANMAYRKSTLVDVGGLDEQFPLPAFEDVDLALLAEPLGKIVFAAKALVIHPWRRVTLRSSLRRLRQFDYLLVTALRHGCLGWKDRPTSHPRLRIALAAAVTLPIGRIKKGLSYMTRSPLDSCRRIGISLIEAVVGLVMAPRWLFGSFPLERGRYLDGATR